MKIFSPENLGLLFLLLITLTAFQTSPEPSSYNSTLVDVVDGDTVDVVINGREDTIRLLGVDTPETHTENVPSEFDLENTSSNRKCLRNYGEKATEYVKRNLENNFTVRTDPEADRRGDYGRLLAYIQHNNTTINQKLVEEGLARVYRSDFSKKNRFLEIEGEAREKDLGIWSCQ